MSKAKTTATTKTTKAPAKATPKAPAKAATPVKGKGKPTKEAAPVSLLDKVLEGLPRNPDQYTAVQLKTLMARYSEAKAKMTPADQLVIRGIGKPATERLNKLATKKVTNDVNAEELGKLALEMNAVMSITPALDPEADDLLARITAEAGALKEADFDSTQPKCFTVYARKTFTKLGIALPGEKKAKKAAKVAGAKRAPREPGEGRTRFNHRPSTNSGKMDLMLEKGATMEQMMKDLDITSGRVSCHLGCLKRKFGATITKSDKGVYKLAK